jgi:hypothetical protein
MAVADGLFLRLPEPADLERAANSSAQRPKAITTAGDDLDWDQVQIGGSGRQSAYCGARGQHCGRKAAQCGATWMCWKDLFLVLHRRGARRLSNETNRGPQGKLA